MNSLYIIKYNQFDCMQNVDDGWLVDGTLPLATFYFIEKLHE